MENITVVLAFTGGLLAFISPCTLPLYPAFISYITGVSVTKLKESNKFKKEVLLHSLFFCLGFSLIYYVLGFSLSKIGQLFLENQAFIRTLGGIFLVFMGLILSGCINLGLIMKTARINYEIKKKSLLNSFLVGLVFAAGWTPCIGPIFGAIMYTNILDPTSTFLNVTFYSLGFCLPFIFMSFFMGRIKLVLKYSSLLMKFGGGIMIVLGLMIYFDKMFYLNMWGSEIQEYFFELWQ
ncbi:cytochrome c biogenesis CcdA family protein [Pseudobacillus badius]|uniref:cytochrome c biogenesis CcdA family protein n=1 Tax=Bacillus badius TaxID=1455 RepID=UPI0007B39D37|nr:cytochrome c biogenesis protein CcdA [Bacillus badius]KZR58724.1 cytochrome C biogenesis protein [Bacillus badius]